MKPGQPLRLVTSMLQGHLPEVEDWPTVIETANRAWLSPALFVALKRTGRLEEIPPHVRDYLSFLHDRNYERNSRLRGQLIEAVSALNDLNIEPILLKGAINLFSADDEALGARMISDLDLSIDPFEMSQASTALMGLGYQSTGIAREMVRPDDVGMLELHDRPSGRSAPYLSDDLLASSTSAERFGAVARIPNAESRALHLIVHDLIKEQDYWSLKIELRHLHDLAELMRSSEWRGWEKLCAGLSGGPARKALILQAAALEDLFGAEIPPELRPGTMARLRHAARLVGASHGVAGTVTRLIGELSRGLHRMEEGVAWRNGLSFPRQVYRRLASPGKSSRL